MEVPHDRRPARRRGCPADDRDHQERQIGRTHLGQVEEVDRPGVPAPRHEVLVVLRDRHGSDILLGGVAPEGGGAVAVEEVHVVGAPGEQVRPVGGECDVVGARVLLGEVVGPEQGGGRNCPVEEGETRSQANHEILPIGGDGD